MKVEQISWADAVKELDALRDEIERLRDALRQIVDRGYGGWPQEIAETALRNEKPSTWAGF